jgi:hypothetical protein
MGRVDTFLRFFDEVKLDIRRRVVAQHKQS